MYSEITGKASRNSLIKLGIAVIVIILSLTLTSCADLGDYKDLGDYYDYFGDVTTFDSDYDDDDYDMDDFYNQDTVEKFKSPIDCKCYTALAIELDKDIDLKSIAIFFTGDNATEQRFQYEGYYCSNLDDMIEKMKNMADKDMFYGVYQGSVKGTAFKLTCDGKGTIRCSIDGEEKNCTYQYNSTLDVIEFEFPVTDSSAKYCFEVRPYSNDTAYVSIDDFKYIFQFNNDWGLGHKIFSRSTSISNREYVGTEISNLLNSDGSKAQDGLKLEEDNYIVIVFRNNMSNCKLYDLEKISFAFTDIMIRSANLAL